MLFVAQAWAMRATDPARRRLLEVRIRRVPPPSPRRSDKTSARPGRCRALAPADSERDQGVRGEARRRGRAEHIHYLADRELRGRHALREELLALIADPEHI